MIVKKNKRRVYKTLKNKVYSLLLIVVGAASILLERDVTVFVVFSLIAIPIFFAKENIIE